MQPVAQLPDPHWFVAILQAIEQHPTGTVLLILLIGVASYAATFAYLVTRK